MVRISTAMVVGALSLHAQTSLVEHQDTWHYRKGTSAPPTDWNTVADAALDASWLAGPGGFWETLDWNEAFTNGMRDVGLSYSGSHEWRDTAMYWSVEHEVMPKEYATPCSQCHESLRTERTCDRCHHQGKR